MELLIDKKYLVRLERYTKFGYAGMYNPFAARYVFKLPKWAGLAEGYTVNIDAQQVIWEEEQHGHRFNDAKPLFTKELENDKTYRLARDNNVVYEAVMTENREEGKRYKRYKFTSEELYSLYLNVNLTTAEYAVAKVEVYLEGKEGNRHQVIYGNRIENTFYLVGKIQGCWLYSSELDTKRRIGTRGITIISRIAPEHKQAAERLIEKLSKDLQEKEERFREIYLIKEALGKQKFEWDFFSKHYCLEDETAKDTVDTLQNVMTNATEKLNLRFNLEGYEKAQIEQAFISEIKKLAKTSKNL